MKILTDKSLYTPLIVTIVALCFGCYFFLSNWQYSEPGHGYLLLAYIACCAPLFIGIRIKKTTVAIMAVLTMASLLFYGDLKFDWRKSYILQAKDGKPFLMEPYIDAYPSLEQHIFAYISSAPKWVDFADICFEPALKKEQINRSCKSQSLILENYNINIEDLINTHFAKMKRTAHNLERGKIKSKKQLQSCLTAKKCAMIPLLPSNADLEQVSQNNEDYYFTRKAFWSLINDKQISPEICEFFDLCSTMRDIGVLAIQKPEIH